MSPLNCRVRRSYPTPRKKYHFRFNRFVHLLKWHAFNLAVAIVFLSWLCRAVWHEAGLSQFVPPVLAVLAGERKTNFDTISNMGVRSCEVSISNMDGIEHTVQVSASTLYEAVALGIEAVTKSFRSDKIPKGLTKVTVRVLEDPTEHSVTIRDFQNWLTRDGGSPSDRAARAKIGKILRRH
jgi:hypothetical protein